MNVFGEDTSGGAGSNSSADEAFTQLGNDLILDPTLTLKVENIEAKNQTIENSTSIEIDDPLVKYGASNTNTALNTGFYSRSGTSYSGVIANGSTTHIIDLETTEPTTTINLNTLQKGNLECLNLGLHGNIIAKQNADLQVASHLTNEIVFKQGSTERVRIDSDGIEIKNNASGVSDLILKGVDRDVIHDNYDNLYTIFKTDKTEPNQLLQIDLISNETVLNTSLEVNGPILHSTGDLELKAQADIDFFTSGSASKTFSLSTVQGVVVEKNDSDLAAVKLLGSHPSNAVKLTNNCINNTNVLNNFAIAVGGSSSNILKYGHVDKELNLYANNKPAVELQDDDIDLHHIFEFNTPAPVKLFQCQNNIAHRWQFETKYNMSSGVGIVNLDCSVLGDPTVIFRIRDSLNNIVAEASKIFANQASLTDLSIVISGWTNNTPILQGLYWFEVYVSNINSISEEFTLRGTQHLELPFVDTQNAKADYEKSFPNLRIESDNLSTTSDKRLRTKLNGILELGTIKDVEQSLLHAMGSVDNHSKHLLSTEKEALLTGQTDLETLTRHITTNSDQGPTNFNFDWEDLGTPYVELYNAGKNIRMTSSDGTFRYVRGDTTFSNTDNVSFVITMLADAQASLIGLCYGDPLNQSELVTNQRVFGLRNNTGSFLVNGTVNTNTGIQYNSGDTVKVEILNGNLIIYVNGVDVGVSYTLPHRTSYRALVADISISHGALPYDLDVNLLNSVGTINGYVQINNDVIVPHKLTLGGIPDVESAINAAGGDLTTLETKTQNMEATTGTTTFEHKTILNDRYCRLAQSNTSNIKDGGFLIQYNDGSDKNHGIVHRGSKWEIRNELGDLKENDTVPAVGSPDEYGTLVLNELLVSGTGFRILLGSTNVGTSITNLETKNTDISHSGLNTTVANNLIVSGDLTISGTTTTINTATVEVEDNVIRLANNNIGDSIDSGFISLYNDGVPKARGLIYKAANNQFEVLTNITNTNPGTTVTGDYADLQCKEFNCETLLLDNNNVQSIITSQNGRLDSLETATTQISYNGVSTLTTIGGSQTKINGEFRAQDNMLKCNVGGYGDDLYDSGFISQYNDGTFKYRGLVYNQAQNAYVLADNIPVLSGENLNLSTFNLTDMKLNKLTAAVLELGSIANVENDINTLNTKTTAISYTVGGTLTTIGGSQTKIEGETRLADNLIKLNIDAYGDDLVDSGFISQYNDGTFKYRGLVYSQVDNAYVLADNIPNASGENLNLSTFNLTDMKLNKLTATELKLGAYEDVETEIDDLKEKTQDMVHTSGGAAIPQVDFDPEFDTTTPVSGATVVTTATPLAGRYQLQCDNTNGTYRWHLGTQSFNIPNTAGNISFTIRNNKTDSKNGCAGIATSNYQKDASLAAQPTGVYAYFYTTTGVSLSVTNGSSSNLGTNSPWNVNANTCTYSIAQGSNTIVINPSTGVGTSIVMSNGTYHVIAGDTSLDHSPTNPDIDLQFTAFSGITQVASSGINSLNVDSELVIENNVELKADLLVQADTVVKGDLTTFGDTYVIQPGGSVKQDGSISAYGYRNYILNTLVSIAPVASPNFTVLKYGASATHNNFTEYNLSIPYVANSDIQAVILRDGTYKINVSIGGEYDFKAESCEYAILKNGTPIYRGGRKGEIKVFEDVGLLAIDSLLKDDIITFGYRNITGNKTFGMYEMTIVIEKMRQNTGFF